MCYPTSSDTDKRRYYVAPPPAATIPKYATTLLQTAMRSLCYSRTKTETPRNGHCAIFMHAFYAFSCLRNKPIYRPLSLRRTLCTAAAPIQDLQLINSASTSTVAETTWLQNIHETFRTYIYHTLVCFSSAHSQENYLFFKCLARETLFT